MKLFKPDWTGTYTIAEMSSNHGGSLETALKIIEEARRVGFDCVKTQYYTADSMTIEKAGDGFDVESGEWMGENLYQLYEKSATPLSWHEIMCSKCNDLGLDYLVSVYDPKDVEEIDALPIAGFKIASFELCSLPLLEKIAATGKPAIISCGMATVQEIERTYDYLTLAECRFALMHCVTSYPAKDEEMNLTTISEMANRFDCPIGFSDHSKDRLSAIAAVALGARLVEKHFCLEHAADLPDSSFSADPKEATEVLASIKRTYAALGMPYRLSPSQEFYRKYRRSLYVVEDIHEGDFLSKENIRAIRPGLGLDPWLYHEAIKKKAARDLRRGEPVSEEMYYDDVHV